MKHLIVCIALAIAALAVGCGNVMAPQAADVASDAYVKGLDAQFDAYMENCVIAGPDGYVVEGDIFVPDLAGVREMYRSFMTPKVASKGTVDVVNGYYDIWNSTAAMNISYCISNNFGTNKSKVVTWMGNANAKWSSAGNVRFVYKSAQDYNATKYNNNVVFNIRPATSYEESTYGKQGVVAWTFFPKYSRSQREYVIFKSAWTFSSFNYLFVHELGHTIGLRHEHIWDGLTSETTAGAELITANVDYKSIMFYNYLPGYTGNNDLSYGDKYTVSYLYGGYYY